MNLLKPCLFALACAFSLQAAAQWQWIDKDGRKVFSDRAPPQEVPEKSILRKPHQMVAPAPSAATGATEGAVPANSTKADAAKPVSPGAGKGVDKELEERMAKADAEKAAKEKAYEQKVAADRAENCSRAKQAKSTLESGQLMKTTNGKGEQVYMDDAKRSAERKRAESVIASDCVR